MGSGSCLAITSLLQMTVMPYHLIVFILLSFLTGEILHEATLRGKIPVSKQQTMDEKEWKN